MRKKDFVLLVYNILNKEYPDAKCSLKTENTLQLLISTELSAQCKDDRVNEVTEKLYKRYKTAFDFAEADLCELEDYIKTLGLYKNKAKNIKYGCKKLCELFGGEVPGTMEQLLEIDGVGRKTANLILGEAFNVPSIVVDTHASRLSQRMGLSKNTDPFKIEMDLKKIVPPEIQTKFCHQLVLHGRKYCNARKPNCDECPVRDICPKKLK
ncbi:MAG: endonuclease III [Clostridia bacterium]|nr:endonuclease III [Clostridia bacterium]